MRLRYGEDFAGSTQAIGYGETVDLGGVTVTFHPAGHVLGSAQVAVEAKGLPDRRLRRLQGRRRSDLRAVRAGAVRRVHHRGDLRPAGVPPSAIRTREIAKLLHSVALFPERAHLVGAYSLGKAQRVIALIRKAGYDEPIYLHGAMESITRYYVEPRHRSRRAAPGARREEGRARRRHRALPAVGAEGSLVAALPRSGRRATPRAGCGCAPARARASWNCRW